MITSPRFPPSPERRLRLGAALTSVLVAAVLCSALAGLALLRGEPLASLAPAVVGIALGLLAEMLCLDIAVRRASGRLRARTDVFPPRDDGRRVAFGAR